MIIFVIISLQMLSVSHSFTLKVFRSGRDYFQSEISLNTTNTECRIDGYCYCIEHYNTFLYDKTSLSGKCVSDTSLVINQPEGRYLALKQGCLGYQHDRLFQNLSCRKDDLSIRWFWTSHGQILNLKTLKCLELEVKMVLRKRGMKEKVVRSLKQCDGNRLGQRWKCFKNVFVKNDQFEYRKKWIKRKNQAPYLTDCKLRSSYKGCYRFSNGELLGIINQVNCQNTTSQKCGEENYSISAPINVHNNICKINWNNTTYSTDGHIWNLVRNNTGSNIKVVKKTLSEVTVKITDINVLVKKWPGTLLKLVIECSDQTSHQEQHCVLFKIEGLSETNFTYQPRFMDQPMVINTDPTLTVTRTTTTGKNNSSMIQESNGATFHRSTIFIVAVVLFSMLFIVLVVVGITLLYQKRKRSTKKETDSHVYEETEFWPLPTPSEATVPSTTYDTSESIYQVIDDDIYPPPHVTETNKDGNKVEENEGPYYHTLERKFDKPT